MKTIILQQKFFCYFKNLVLFFAVFAFLFLSHILCADPIESPNSNPPDHPVKIIFIHHSTGQNWLDDSNGGVGIALRNNNYFVSDTNYGWHYPIGDRTDIGNWYEWFRGSSSSSYMGYLYAENGQYCSYSRLATDPGGQNEIVMFKSCFPNSALKGSPGDPVPPIGSNPLRGQDAFSPYHTVANAEGIYIDILEYFRAHQEKLFIVITAPPLSDGTYSANARAFNNWLINDWLDGYPYNNVFVFDFYNVLTGPNNHHRWLNGEIQHTYVSGQNTLAYPSGDDHPSQTGNLKTTAEFLPLLNIAYNHWKSTPAPTPSVTLLVTPSSRTITIGESATYTVNITRVNFTGDVILSATGLPIGATAGFSPNPATGTSSTLIINTTSGTSTGSSTTTISGGAVGITIAPVTAQITVNAPVVNNPPTASISANPASGDFPLTVNFTGSGTDTDGTIVSYLWNFGDGTTSTQQNPGHTYNSAGSYTARLTVTDDDGATGTANITITVTTPNTPPPAGNMYYIATTGNDGNPGTEVLPWRTFGHAFSIMSGGDTLIVEDGTYDEAIRTPPSGQEGHYTIIKARNAGRAIIKPSSLGQFDTPLKIYGKEYIQIVGLKVLGGRADGTITGNVSLEGCKYIKIDKCAFCDEGYRLQDGDSTGNIASVSTTGCSYILFQDCRVWGAGRYSFVIHSSEKVIVRRCVARIDTVDTIFPIAAFCSYISRDVQFQNCIAIDCRDMSIRYRGSDGAGFRGAYSIEQDPSLNVEILGSIALNIDAAGIFGNYSNGTHIVKDNVIWYCKGGISLGGATPPDTDIADHNTIGKIYGEWVGDVDITSGVGALGTWTNNTIRNSLIYAYNLEGIKRFQFADYNNIYSTVPGSVQYGSWWTSSGSQLTQPPGQHDMHINPNLKYLVRIESDSPLKGAASDGGDIGANILYRRGVSGTLWGEPGYDVLTNEPLWPFPNEDMIRNDMMSYNSEQNPLKARGDRGFCENRLALDGQPLTLTRYIWEYLGYPTPPEIYGGQPPVNQPAITSFSPANGSVGASVVINGSNLTGATRVTFNNIEATYNVVSSSQINTTVPTGTTTGRIRVTTPTGTAVSSADFTVTEIPPPNQPPLISSVTAEPANGTAPLTVNFTCTANDPDGQIASYLWDFNDGTTGTQQNPSHTYNTAGSYTAMLTVTDDDGATAQSSLSIVVSSSPVSGNTYYVAVTGSDSNPGTETQPWRTLQHAVDMVHAGDTVLVSNGTYAGFHSVNSGTSANPITFRANGDNVIVNSRNSVTTDNINVEETDYYVIDGFKVINAERDGMRVVEARGVVVQNCRVENSFRFGIHAGFTPEIQILNNITCGSRTQHGIYACNSTEDDGFIISSNRSYSNASIGIHINADIDDMGGDGFLRNLIIENNIIYNNGTKGLDLSSVTDSIIRNNLIHDNGRSGGGAGGLHIYAEAVDYWSTNNVIVNNTIVESAIAAIRINDGNVNNILFNNICISLSNYPIAFEGSGNYEDHNLKLGSTAGVFVNPDIDDYHLASTSTALNTGVASYREHDTPLTDIEGSIRPLGAGYDIGAYEMSYSPPPPNNPPVLESIGNKSVTENQQLAFTVNATDPDGDTLTYTANSLPGGASFTGQSFTWTPAYTQSGTYDVTFIVSDGLLTDSETIRITVANVNRAPVLSAIGNKTVSENQQLSFTVSASDPDGDTLTYTADSLPGGANFTGQLFTWTPTYTQAGSYSVVFTVSDGSLTDGESITITVNNVNRAPVIQHIDPITVNEGQTVSISPAVSDPDGDTVTVIYSGWMNSSTYTTDYDDAGEHTVTVTATDGVNSVSQDIGVTVLNVNRAPVLGDIGSKVAITGEKLEFSINGSDPDGDILSYMVSGLPDGGMFSDQIFTWVPTREQVGSYTLTFTVSDGVLEDSETIAISVESDIAPIVIAPSIDNWLIYYDPTPVIPDDSLTCGQDPELGVEVLNANTHKGAEFGIACSGSSGFSLPGLNIRERPYLSLLVKPTGRIILSVGVICADGVFRYLMYSQSTRRDTTDTLWYTIHTDDGWNNIAMNIEKDLYLKAGVHLDYVAWLCLRGQFSLGEVKFLESMPVNIELLSPQPGEEIFVRQINVHGVCDGAVDELRVNGNPSELHSDGSFSLYNLPLETGENFIRATAYQIVDVIKKAVGIYCDKVFVNPEVVSIPRTDSDWKMYRGSGEVTTEFDAGKGKNVLMMQGDNCSIVYPGFTPPGLEIEDKFNLHLELNATGEYLFYVNVMCSDGRDRYITISPQRNIDNNYYCSLTAPGTNNSQWQDIDIALDSELFNRKGVHVDYIRWVCIAGGDVSIAGIEFRESEE